MLQPHRIYCAYGRLPDLSSAVRALIVSGLEVASELELGHTEGVWQSSGVVIFDQTAPTALKISPGWRGIRSLPDDESLITSDSPSFQIPLSENTMPRRHGFTLVELLVVIAIIGILVALLLPAVQAAREAARRTDCKSRLRQQAIAVSLYHDTKGHYPPGRAGSPRFPEGTEQHAVSWAFYLLPFVEEQSLADAWVPTARSDADSNAVAMRTPVSTFHCPSRRSPAADRDFDNEGAVSAAPASGAGGDFAANAGLSTRNGMPSYGRAKFDGETFGPMYTNSAVPARRVIDGLSKTFCIGEKHLPPEPAETPEGLKHAEQGDTAFFAGGNRHGAVRRSSAGFPQNRDETYRGHFGSEHSGMSHFAFLDGSVRALQHDLDQEFFDSLAAVADGGFIPNDVIDDND